MLTRSALSLRTFSPWSSHCAAFCKNLPNARPIGIPYGEDFYSFPIDHELPESDLTNYDSLGQLIDKYNAVVFTQESVGIDRGLVEIRDALAHGRVSAEVTSDTLRLIKFSKPKNGLVRVTFNALLSEEWFAEQKRRSVEALREVVRSRGAANLSR
jgi:hypothetical protein